MIATSAACHMHVALTPRRKASRRDGGSTAMAWLSRSGSVTDALLVLHDAGLADVVPRNPVLMAQLADQESLRIEAEAPPAHAGQRREHRDPGRGDAEPQDAQPRGILHAGGIHDHTDRRETPSRRGEAAPCKGDVDPAQDRHTPDPGRIQAPLAQPVPQDVYTHDRAAAEERECHQPDAPVPQQQGGTHSGKQQGRPAVDQEGQRDGQHRRAQYSRPPGRSCEPGAEQPKNDGAIAGDLQQETAHGAHGVFKGDRHAPAQAPGVKTRSVALLNRGWPCIRNGPQLKTCRPFAGADGSAARV
jgi:hypothetical protein